MPITTQQYLDLIFGAIDDFKAAILTPNVGSSRIRTRYVTSEGMDDESWLGHLRDENGKTDIWLMTPMMLRGKSLNEREQQDAVGTFSKPFDLALDFFYDYKQGLDYDNSDLMDIKTNSEREFLEKVWAVDLALELKRGCLGTNVQINGWSFKLRIKRFQNASTHYLNGVVNLQLVDVFLNQ